mmetsp:Transcript_42308/g.76509  ORF Transcript_42308/g.76509 Transcript_42308/m.76509 type:complete len:204 (+) Transcript_42308:2166-2777(+)
MLVAVDASAATCEACISKTSSPVALSPRAALTCFRASSAEISLVSQPSADFCSVFNAFSAMARASGSAIFSVAALTRGSSLGMIGRTAAGSSTTLHMLSTIWQQVRFTSSLLSFRPRESTGNMTARAGASTFCTKMQPASFSTHLCVFVMDCAASTTEGRKGSKSLLPVQPAMAVMHSTAASLTSFLMSQVRSATGDTRITRA